MTVIEIIVWSCAACTAYTYAAYPLLLASIQQFFSPATKRSPFEGSVSVVVAALNEASRIEGRRDELTEMLRATGLTGEVIIASDGSTDDTAAVAERGAPDCVRVIDLEENVGKAEALTRACASAVGEIIVFGDARQRWAPDALRLLLENFADNTVGGVSGDLELEAAPGVNAGIGVYWKYEKRVRMLESRIHSTVGVTGAISAVRRRLFRPIPRGTILDDVCWPMDVVSQGYRVIHDGRARAYDRLPDHARDEFRRKVRTLSGNFQLVAHRPQLLLPWRNPIWMQFLSHKLMRLAVPWLLLGMMMGTALLMPSRRFYRATFAVQVIGYLFALAGMFRVFASRSRLASAAAAFLVLNCAAWVAFWVWILGRSANSWGKIAYSRLPEPDEPVPSNSTGSAAESNGPVQQPPVESRRLARNPVMRGDAAKLQMLGLVFVILGSAQAGPLADGHTYVVAKAGRDANPGTETRPFETIQHAANLAQAGDTVVVRPGKYPGFVLNWTTKTVATGEAPISFVGEDGAIIDEPNAYTPDGIDVEPGAGWLTLRNFHVVNGSGRMSRACIRVAGNDNVRILDNRCEKAGTWGIFISMSSDVLIQHNVCSGSVGEHGIYVSRGARRVTIRSNTIYGNNWDGLHLNGGREGPIDRIIVERNIIEGNNLSGIDADGVRNSVFCNNLVYGNGKHALTLYNIDTAAGCTGNRIVYNTLVAHEMFAVQMRRGSTANLLFGNVALQTAEHSMYGSIGTDGDPAALTSDYNVVSDRFSTTLGTTGVSLGEWRAQTRQDGHSLVAERDGVFVNASAGDYHSKPGAAGVGVIPPSETLEAAPSTDLDGNARLRGSAYDIGAYQYTRRTAGVRPVISPPPAGRPAK